MSHVVSRASKLLGSSTPARTPSTAPNAAFGLMLTTDRASRAST